MSNTTALIWKYGLETRRKRKPGRQNAWDLERKAFRDALRMEIAAAEDFKDLRAIALFG
jgi:hypothetical protein